MRSGDFLDLQIQLPTRFVMKRLLIACMIFMATAASAQRSPTDVLADARSTLSGIEKSQGDIAVSDQWKRFVTLHRELVSQLPEISKLNDEQVITFHRLLSGAAFYTLDREIMTTYRLAFDEMKRRDLLTSDLITRMHERLFLAGDFGAAASLAIEFKLGSELDISIGRQSFSKDGNGFRIWTLTPSGALDGSTLELPKGRFLLVLGNPLCKFSRNATEQMERNPALLATMKERSRWIIAPGSRWSPRMLRSWSAAHPNLPFSAVAEVGDFRGLQSWATPTFYVFQDGQLIDHFAGWPVEGNQEKLRVALNLK